MPEPRDVRESTIRSMRLFGIALVAWCIPGCAFNPLYPDLRTAADRAREVLPRCKRDSEAGDAHVLSPEIVEAVEPAFSYVASGSDRAPRLRGARLHIRPEPTFSSEILQRSLECHESRITLGAVAGRSDDPYWLPDTWLDIKAESTGDGFVVSVLVDRTEKAQQILDRARKFVAPRP